MSAAYCSRCGRRFRETAPDADGWNGTYIKGVLVGAICPTCQTPEENAEAEINAATIEYRADAFGRLVGRPKGVLG